jgi:hypothetical protein
MMCMSDAVSVNIVHNFPKMYGKGKGTELLFISNRCTLNPAIRVQISVEPKRIFLFLVNYSLHIVLLHETRPEQPFRMLNR